MDTHREVLKKMKVSQLKDIIRKYNLKYALRGYSRMRKVELIEAMLQYRKKIFVIKDGKKDKKVKKEEKKVKKPKKKEKKEIIPSLLLNNDIFTSKEVVYNPEMLKKKVKKVKKVKIERFRRTRMFPQKKLIEKVFGKKLSGEEANKRSYFIYNKMSYAGYETKDWIRDFVPFNKKMMKDKDWEKEYNLFQNNNI